MLFENSSQICNRTTQYELSKGGNSETVHGAETIYTLGVVVMVGEAKTKKQSSNGELATAMNEAIIPPEVLQFHKGLFECNTPVLFPVHIALSLLFQNEGKVIFMAEPAT